MPSSEGSRSTAPDDAAADADATGDAGTDGTAESDGAGVAVATGLAVGALEPPQAATTTATSNAATVTARDRPPALNRAPAA